MEFSCCRALSSTVLAVAMEEQLDIDWRSMAMAEAEDWLSANKNSNDSERLRKH